MSHPDRFAEAVTATLAARRRRHHSPRPGRWLVWYTVWVAVAVYGFAMLSLSLAGVIR